MQAYIGPIAQACRELVASFAGEAVEFSPGSRVEKPLVTRIEVSGQPGVSVWIGAKQETICYLHEQALGMPADSLPEIIDFLGEISNQLLGPAATLLPNVQPNTLSIPVSEEHFPDYPTTTLKVGEHFVLLKIRAQAQESSA